MPYEKPEDHLNIWELLMKKRREEESPEDYKDTYSELKRKLSGLEPLIQVSQDGIAISAMKVNYSRENLEKVLDFINDITEGEVKL